MSPDKTDNSPDRVRVSLSLADYDYELPSNRIAETPARPRDRSRLLLVDRTRSTWTDSTFQALASHLKPGDLLVLNNTRVLKARLFGTLERSGRSVEILFADPIDRHSWQALLNPGRRVREGDRIALDNNLVIAVGARGAYGLRTLSLIDPSGPSILEILEKDGHLPLPPYMERDDRSEDETDYQTVYANRDGAIAAPTAGLHFSDAVFASLEGAGIQTAELTLHVGIGTFIPVRTNDPAEHRLKAERYEISEAAAEQLSQARAEGRRIIAVGTTTTRTLEHVFAKDDRFLAGTGETDLYILPGHRFTAVDGLLTNFHLPRSTLLLLVSAFSSRKLVFDAYSHAIDKGYRFYSYGDCTLFL
jgi:S-adenosylmethionine:tRNA ribosyltransferase-isomerase